jgi:hypothetical protein
MRLSAYQAPHPIGRRPCLAAASFNSSSFGGKILAIYFTLPKKHTRFIALLPRMALLQLQVNSIH